MAIDPRMFPYIAALQRGELLPSNLPGSGAPPQEAPRRPRAPLPPPFRRDPIPGEDLVPPTGVAPPGGFGNPYTVGGVVASSPRDPASRVSQASPLPRGGMGAAPGLPDPTRMGLLQGGLATLASMRPSRDPGATALVPNLAVGAMHGLQARDAQLQQNLAMQSARGQMLRRQNTSDWQWLNENTPMGEEMARLIASTSDPEERDKMIAEYAKQVGEAQTQGVLDMSTEPVRLEGGGYGVVSTNPVTGEATVIEIADLKLDPDADPVEQRRQDRREDMFNTAMGNDVIKSYFDLMPRLIAAGKSVDTATSAADFVQIVNYLKGLDPESAVMQGEGEAVRALQTFLDAQGERLDRALGGDTSQLSPEFREELFAQISNLAAAADRGVAATMNIYNTEAERRGLFDGEDDNTLFSLGSLYDTLWEARRSAQAGRSGGRASGGSVSDADRDRFDRARRSR